MLSLERCFVRAPIEYAGAFRSPCGCTFSGAYAPGAGVSLAAACFGRAPMELARPAVLPCRDIFGLTNCGPGVSDFLMKLLGKRAPKLWAGAAFFVLSAFDWPKVDGRP